VAEYGRCAGAALREDANAGGARRIRGLGAISPQRDESPTFGVRPSPMVTRSHEMPVSAHAHVSGSDRRLLLDEEHRQPALKLPHAVMEDTP
jgi:hypothetical protein